MPGVQGCEPLHHEAALEAERVVTALYGFVLWVPSQCKIVPFQLVFRILVSERNSKYNIVSSLLSYFVNKTIVFITRSCGCYALLIVASTDTDVDTMVLLWYKLITRK